MSDPTLPDDELLRTARAYLAQLNSEPPPRHLEEDAMQYAFSRRRRFSIAAVLGGSAVVFAGLTATVVVLAFHHGPLAGAPAAVATPSASATATGLPITRSPTPDATKGWKAISSAHLRLSFSYPPQDVATICRLGSPDLPPHPGGSGTDLEIQVGSVVSSCPIYGYDQPFNLMSATNDSSQATRPRSSVCDPAKAVVHDGVIGTRTACGIGPVMPGDDVIYVFHTNGLYYQFVYHRSAGAPDLTSTFDIIVSTVRFHS